MACRHLANADTPTPMGEETLALAHYGPFILGRRRKSGMMSGLVGGRKKQRAGCSRDTRSCACAAAPVTHHQASLLSRGYVVGGGGDNGKMNREETFRLVIITAFARCTQTDVRSCFVRTCARMEIGIVHPYSLCVSLCLTQAKNAHHPSHEPIFLFSKPKRTPCMT